MKKIKFMMPALAIASTAAITPFVTSCKKNEEETAKSFAFEFMKDKKFAEYKSQIQPAAKATLKSYGELEKMYFEDVTANPQIFADDYFLYISYYMNKSKSTLQNLCKNLTLTISNIKVESAMVPTFAQLDYERQNFYTYSVKLDIVPNDKTISSLMFQFDYIQIPTYFDGIEDKKWYTYDWQFINIAQQWYTRIEKQPWLYAFTPSLRTTIKVHDADNKVKDDFTVEFKPVNLKDDGTPSTRELTILQEKQKLLQKALAQYTKSPMIYRTFLDYLYFESTYLTNIKVSE